MEGGDRKSKQALFDNTSKEGDEGYGRLASSFRSRFQWWRLSKNAKLVRMIRLMGKRKSATEASRIGRVEREGGEKEAQNYFLESLSREAPS